LSGGPAIDELELERVITLAATVVTGADCGAVGTVAEVERARRAGV
jgi:hypothetical protein